MVRKKWSEGKGGDKLTKRPRAHTEHADRATVRNAEIKK